MLVAVGKAPDAGNSNPLSQSGKEHPGPASSPNPEPEYISRAVLYFSGPAPGKLGIRLCF